MGGEHDRRTRWIALALVVFASWRVFRVLLGAWLFGLASILHLVAQGIGLSIPANLLAMLPYAATILVLVLLSAMPCAPGCMPRFPWASRGRPGTDEGRFSISCFNYLYILR